MAIHAHRPGERLRQFIATETEALIRVISVYVTRAGLCRVNEARATATELLNEVVIEALAHEARFDATREPMAWLLGIAANLIRRRQSQIAALDRREPLVRDVYQNQSESMSDDELFDRVANLAMSALDPEYITETNALASAMLNAVSHDDRQVLRLAIMHDLDGNTVARELGISPGAARVRLYRAIRRLREVWLREGNNYEQ